MKLGYVTIMPLIVFLILLAGWGQSIHKFTKCDFEAPYKCEIVYGVGLFPPIGMFVGWINIDNK